MNKCGICKAQFMDEELTEIGLGSNCYQCEQCWNNYGGDIPNA
jgi:hypothetical protein